MAVIGLKCPFGLLQLFNLRHMVHSGVLFVATVDRTFTPCVATMIDMPQIKMTTIRYAA
jgi:hypothetical protein